MTPPKISMINARIIKLKSPSKIGRTLRPLSDCTHWKASEWRSWLFFFGPICLQGILPLPYFRHFCLLSAAIYFFSRSPAKNFSWNSVLVFHGKFLHVKLGTENFSMENFSTESTTENVTMENFSMENFSTANSHRGNLPQHSLCLMQVSTIKLPWCCFFKSS